MSGKIEVGKIVTAVGIKGEVKVYSFGDDPEKFLNYKTLSVSGYGKLDIEKVRKHGNTAVIKLKGIDDRTSAEKLRGRAAYVEEADLRELPEGEYYIKDIIGLDVFDANTGEKVGTLAEVFQSGPQDIYRIRIAESGKDALVPAVSEFIKNIDIEKGIIEISFIEGMI